MPSSQPAQHYLDRFRFYLLSAMALCVATILCFSYYIYSTKQIETAEELRLNSIQLAKELQRSSDDLTRMARSYVMTGNPRFEQQFHAVIEIRDGKRLRPQEYFRAYWGLIGEDGKLPRPDSQQKIAFLDLLQQSQFTTQEIAIISQAKQVSDQLAQTEKQAMQLRKQSGSFLEAAPMLFGPAYDEKKRQITHAVDQFYQQVQQRTNQLVKQRRAQADLALSGFALLGLLLLTSIYQAYRSMHRTMGGTIQDIYNVIHKIGRGDFSCHLSAAPPDSILAWLTATQHQLTETEQNRSQLLAIVEQSTDLICTASPEGQIQYINSAGRTMLGLSEKDNLKGLTLKNIHPKEQWQHLQNIAIPHALEHGSWHGENLVQHPDGHSLAVSQLIIAHQDQQQQLAFLSTIVRDISSFKQIEAELRYFRTTLDLTQDCVFMFSPDDLHFIYANRGAESQVGYSQQELLQMTPLQLKPELDEATFRAKIAVLLNGQQESVLFETIHQHKNGSRIPVEVFVQYIAPIGGAPRFMNIVRDISLRKKTEALLSQQRNDLQAILDTVVDAIITIDEHGLIQSFNKAAESIFLYQANEVMGKNINMLMPEPFHSQHDGYLHNYVSSGQAKVIGIGREVIGLRKNGQQFPLDLAVSEAQTPVGRRFTGIVRDITERKKAQEQLQQQKQSLQTILDTVVDAIITIDGRGMVQSFNKAAELIFQYQADEVIGRNINMLMPEPYHGEHDGYLAHYLSTGQARIIGIGREVSGLRKDGSIFPLELAVSEADTPNGKRFTGIVRDVTERKRIEKMKNEFVSTVSHELRTPLTSIIGSLGLVAAGITGELRPQTKTLIDLAHKNSQQLVVLINDMLDLEKLQSGRMNFDLHPFSIMVLVKQAIATTSGYFSKWQNHCELVASVDDAVKVYVDETRLQQVMANLLSNAAKFSPANSVVQVGVEQGAQHVRVWVQDQGPGISAEFKTQMFQKFSQADSSATRTKGGSGLGLSIVKELLHQMKGEIFVDSEEGHGARFYFELPTLSNTSHTHNPLLPTILYLENEIDNRTVLAQLLSNIANIDAAATIADAQQLLKHKSYALIMVDLSLDNAEGEDLLIRIRQLSPQPPVMIYTTEEPSSEVNAQVAAVLIKTRVTASMLTAQIQKLLSRTP